MRIRDICLLLLAVASAAKMREESAKTKSPQHRGSASSLSCLGQ